MKVVNIVVNNIDPLAALQMVVEERGLLKKNGYKGIFDAFLCRVRCLLLVHQVKQIKFHLNFVRVQESLKIVFDGLSTL